MITDDELWFAPIRPQAHADARIEERLGWTSTEQAFGEIHLGFLFDRWGRDLPRWCGGHAARKDDRDERLYVWEETFSRCWVLRRGTRTLYLVTVILEPTYWRALEERLRGVRAGRTRA